jgi:DNA primase
MDLSPEQVKAALNYAGVTYNPNKINQGWMDTLCMYHPDRNYGNAFVNIYTGAFKCFSCGATADMIKMLREVKNLSFSQALSVLNIENTFTRNPVSVRKKMSKEAFREIEESFDVDYLQMGNPMFLLTTSEFNPEDWDYCRRRGIDSDFVNHFGIKLCLDGWYKDYMIIPIVDKRVTAFEARKLKEYETLEVVLNQAGFSAGRSLEERREQLSQMEKNLGIHCKTVENRETWYFGNGKEITTPEFLYLKKRKVLYPKHRHINRTLFNYEGIDPTKPVYIREGITGLAKVRKKFGNQVLATFGTNLSDAQINLLNAIEGLKIFIPDSIHDKASIAMLDKVFGVVNKTAMIPVEVDDDHPEFESELNKNPISINRFFCSMLPPFRRLEKYLT